MNNESEEFDESKVIVGVATNCIIPTVILGIPWDVLEQMVEGDTARIELTNAGLTLNLILFFQETYQLTMNKMKIVATEESTKIRLSEEEGCGIEQPGSSAGS